MFFIMFRLLYITGDLNLDLAATIQGSKKQFSASFKYLTFFFSHQVIW